MERTRHAAGSSEQSRSRQIVGPTDDPKGGASVGGTRLTGMCGRALSGRSRGTGSPGDDEGRLVRYPTPSLGRSPACSDHVVADDLTTVKDLPRQARACADLSTGIWPRKSAMAVSAYCQCHARITSSS